VVSPIISKTPKRFWWNIDAKVGLNAPNNIFDVQLVQMGYVAILENPRNIGLMTKAEKDAFTEITPGEVCTGREDDVLVQAIRAHEAHRGGTQDGCVSPLSQSHLTYVAGGHEFTLILRAMNNSFRTILGDQFPRIDQLAECPGGLQQVVRLVFADPLAS
jgi:hypothetical protein